MISLKKKNLSSRNICILDYPEVMECLLRMPSIEPRTINLFVKDEYKDTFPEIFKRNFGDDNFLLMTREEVLQGFVSSTEYLKVCTACGIDRGVW